MSGRRGVWVGRERELGRLDDVLGQALDGSAEYQCTGDGELLVCNAEQSAFEREVPRRICGDGELCDAARGVCERIETNPPVGASRDGEPGSNDDDDDSRGRGEGNDEGGNRREGDDEGANRDDDERGAEGSTDERNNGNGNGNRGNRD